MRLAIVSDIHSNVFALEAVVDDIDRRGIDTVVNLGDILYGPIAPRATYDLLMTKPWQTISGNQERQIVEAGELEIKSNPTLGFIRDDLGMAPLEWMAALPFDLKFSDDIYLCHGTPSDDSVYLLDDIESGVAQVRSDSYIEALLNGMASPVILCGHTHKARTVTTLSGTLIVNPGSVGLPAYTDDLPNLHSMESFSPHASYAILENNSHGWNVMTVRVAYDHRKAAERAKENNRKDWAHFISTGRGLAL